ncbi:hypothetical protein [Sorangium sp. So ce1024]|uniref:hypothetical protein n=1 Tax=Sorangium sp. So ce1024 TaxID=3133327 RepID=UPI003F0B542B
MVRKTRAAVNGEGRRRRGDPRGVVIVSDHAETLDGLQDYLQRAGVTAHVTRHLRAAVLDGADVVAVVLFPDEYPLAEVEATVERLLRERPSVLPVLVTRNPRQFGALGSAAGARDVPAIIPKPAWGWTILDLIRARVEV